MCRNLLFDFKSGTEYTLISPGWPMLAERGWVWKCFQGIYQVLVMKFLFANARPDPLFRHLSKSFARRCSGSAIYAIKFQRWRSRWC